MKQNHALRNLIEIISALASFAIGGFCFYLSYLQNWWFIAIGVHFIFEGLFIFIPMGIKDEYKAMRQAGIDPEVGLRFCQNDKELYTSIILDYAQSSVEKIQNIEAFYKNSDWKNYGISVHALKSTSKTIGALDLSERALRLEKAANDENVDIIHAEHDNMLAQYKKVVEAINTANSNSNENSKQEDDVLEFSPEDDVLEFPAE